LSFWSWSWRSGWRSSTLRVRRSRLLDVKVCLLIFVHRQILPCFWRYHRLVWIIHIEQSQWRQSNLFKHPFEEGLGLFVVWLEFSVPGKGSLLLSVLVKSGPIVCDRLSLLISPRGTAILTDIIRLSNVVSDSQSISISLLSVVDGDFSRLTTLRRDVPDCNVRASCEKVNDIDSVVFSLYCSALWTATEIDCDPTLLQQSAMVSWRFMRWPLRQTGDLLKKYTTASLILSCFCIMDQFQECEDWISRMFEKCWNFSRQSMIKMCHKPFQRVRFPQTVKDLIAVECHLRYWTTSVTLFHVKENIKARLKYSWREYTSLSFRCSEVIVCLLTLKVEVTALRCALSRLKQKYCDRPWPRFHRSWRPFGLCSVFCVLWRDCVAENRPRRGCGLSAVSSVISNTSISFTWQRRETVKPMFSAM
jgi:hypothetical protein